jgi:hypothetical protein
MFKSGDTTLGACAHSVSEMIPACTTVAQLATLDATHLGEFTSACRAICEDCEKECRKHADVHPSAAASQSCPPRWTTSGRRRVSVNALSAACSRRSTQVEPALDAIASAGPNAARLLRRAEKDLNRFSAIVDRGVAAKVIAPDDGDVLRRLAGDAYDQIVLPSA